MNEIISRVTEAVTQPSNSVPAVGMLGVANFYAMLPEAINILTIIYLFLLVLHKGYVLYQEWKHKKIIKD